jgi:hypothetical protein
VLPEGPDNSRRWRWRQERSCGDGGVTRGQQAAVAAAAAAVLVLRAVKALSRRAEEHGHATSESLMVPADTQDGK